MAGFNVYLQVLDGSKFIFASDYTYGKITNSNRNKLKRIIHHGGMVPKSQGTTTGSTTTWKAWFDASDISTYKKLKTNDGIGLDITFTGLTTTNPPYPQYTSSQYFATDAGNMNGVQSNTVTNTFRIYCRADAGMGLEQVFCECYVYHRTTGGTETLLTNFEVGPITIVNAVYDTDVTITSQFDTNERIVFRYRFRNDGSA